MNLPNRLTMFRVMLIPLFLSLLPVSRIGAVGVFALACFTDWLDGFIARRQNLITNFGKLMDPLADKLLVAAALVAMVELGCIPAWIAILIISREFLVTGLRLAALEKRVVIAAGYWAKWKTAVTMVMIGFVLADFPGAAAYYAGQTLIWLSVGLTVASAAEYIARNYKLLKS